jgi:hypothetical protein
VECDTYHGASVIDLSILDWHFCRMAILDLLAQPHSSMPYVRMGFMTTLYTTTLFSRDNGDFLPKSQYSCSNFRSVCLLFFAICSLQFSFPSICIPKYFTDSDSGINMLLKKTGGHRFFLSVNVTCVDLVSFILIFHFVAQASIKIMCCCRWVDAVEGIHSLPVSQYHLGRYPLMYFRLLVSLMYKKKVKLSLCLAN